jgi:hypothetical protein
MPCLTKRNEIVTDYTDKTRFPNKLLVDGSVSMMKMLPGGQWARVREYPNGSARWTWNFDPRIEKKKEIPGRIDGNKFVPVLIDDHRAIYNHFERVIGAGAGCMEVLL